MEENMLPCPFCGRPGAIQCVEGTRQYYPRCPGGSQKFCLLTQYPDSEEDGFVLREDAITVWNQRPTQKLGDTSARMDCQICTNYQPIKVERPTDHPNRIFAEDLRVGMTIRRHGSINRCKLIVILGKVEDRSVPALQLSVGHAPFKCNMWLAAAGLEPYDDGGKWQVGAWCEEVT